MRYYYLKPARLGGAPPPPPPPPTPNLVVVPTEWYLDRHAPGNSTTIQVSLDRESATPVAVMVASSDPSVTVAPAAFDLGGGNPLSLAVTMSGAPTGPDSVVITASAAGSAPATVQVTRPAFVPGMLAGLGLWLRADTGVTTDVNGNVSAWADLSGNNRDAAQATASLQPQRVASLVNGLPAIRFDGVDDFLLGTTLLAGDVPFTLFAVVRKEGPGTANAYFIIGFDMSFGLALCQAVSANRGGFLNGGVAWRPETAPDLADNMVYRQSLRRTGGTTIYERVGGPSFSVNESPTGAPYGSYRVGRHNTSPGIAQPVAVCEIVFYTVALGAADRSKVGDYLLSRWGV